MSLVGGFALDSTVVGRAGMMTSVLAFLDGRLTGGMLINFRGFVKGGEIGSVVSYRN